jgi:hypothetical protein
MLGCSAATANADATLTSTGGRFTVQVPAIPVVTSEVTYNRTHHRITTHHFHMEDAGVTYNISYADGVGEMPYDVYLDIAPVCKQMTDPIRVSTGGVAGIFFTGTLGPDYWYNYHVYKKGDRLYYIFIFAPKIENFGRAQGKITALNDSFKIGARLLTRADTGRTSGPRYQQQLGAREVNAP